MGSVQALVSHGWHDGCTSLAPCPKCHGDCDSDSDCALGLKCFEREYGTTGAVIPGCALGGPGDVHATFDYCYQPHHGEALDLVHLAPLPWDGCTSTAKCPRCHGDCDSDTDCAEGLKCFHRNQHEDVPGCWGGGPGDYAAVDYCVPLNAEEYCARKCQGEGYCCNDISKGSNHMFSCAQACHMRARNVPASSLLTSEGGLCDRNVKSGCSYPALIISAG